MGRAFKPLCGFGQTVLYYDFGAFADYKAKMRNFPNMVTEVSERSYGKVWRKQYRHLNNK